MFWRYWVHTGSAYSVTLEESLLSLNKKIPWQIKAVLNGLLLGGLAGYLTSPGSAVVDGICTSRFMTVIAGSLHLHDLFGLKYVPLEFLGVVLGALTAALIFKEWKGVRTADFGSLIIKFLIGIVIIFGAIVFVGCPIRAYVRLGMGDIPAFAGVIGLGLGILSGTFFLSRGFVIGRNQRRSKVALIFPMVIFLLILAILLKTGFDVGFLNYLPEYQKVIKSSQFFLLLISGFVIGIVAQRSRFCTVSAVRDTFVAKDLDFLSGLAAFILAVLLVMRLTNQQFFGSLAGSQFNAYINVLSMFVVGLGSTFIGGCPFRQLIKACQGELDAMVVITGMLVGAGITFRFYNDYRTVGVASPTFFVLILLVIFLFILGFTLRGKN